MESTASPPPPILVPVDFSSHSLAALIWAAKTADLLGCPLEVLHVIHDPESAPGYYQKHSRHWQRIETAAREMMDEFMDQAIADSPKLKSLRDAERHLVVGIPVNRILELAEKQGAALLVMGSQGLAGLPKLLLGSKAQRVVQLSPIPVTIVKAERAETTDAHGVLP